VTGSEYQAADALHEIEHTQRRSAVTYGYRRTSPYLILWGVIWIVGYTGIYLRPHWWALWPALTVVGIAASFFFKSGSVSKASSAYGWRYGATAVVLFLFFWATFAVLPPKSGVEVGAFLPVCVALSYAIYGIWNRAVRMLLLGLAVGALTLGGYFYLPHYFLLWMAAVGGGALLLGGLWLRGA
jgi:hypothetical protein